MNSAIRPIVNPMLTSSVRAPKSRSGPAFATRPLPASAGNTGNMATARKNVSAARTRTGAMRDPRIGARMRSSTGPASIRAISRALRPSCRTASGVMGGPSERPSLEAPDQRADEQVPAVDEDEDHELERQRDEYRRQGDHPHRGEDRGHDH